MANSAPSSREPQTTEEYLAAILAELRKLNEQAIGIELSIDDVEKAVRSISSTSPDREGES